MGDWLAAGEKVTSLWPGSTKLTAAFGPLSAFASPDLWLRATDRHRLQLTLPDGSTRVFASPADATLRVLGPGGRTVAQLPTVIVEITPRGELPFRVLLNNTVETYLPRWNGAHGSFSARAPDAPAPRVFDEAQLTLPCGTCGSPMGSPSGRAEITCPHCGTRTSLPAEAVARQEWIEQALHGARRAGDLFDDEQVMRLTQLETSTYGRATAVAALPLLGMLTAFVVAPMVAARFQLPPASFGAEVAAFATSVGWLGLALGIVAGLVVTHRRRLAIYRRELRGHLACIALPHDTVAARCRYCNAGLAIATGFTTCEYCGACNLATAEVARAAIDNHARRAVLFDHRAREAREAERAHLTRLVTSIQRGYSLGAIVLAPAIGAVLAVALAAIHLATG